MKHCNKSSECPYGHAFEKNTCAYREDLQEYDLCPLLFDYWEEVIDTWEDYKRKGLV